MAKQTTFFLLLVCLVVINSGCSGSIKDYEPQSPDEQAIVSVIEESQQTWNNGDTKGWLALWHPDAKIMYGRQRSIASKNEYAKMIQERMAANPSYKFGSPKISVSGNEAVVKTSIRMRGRSMPVVLNLIKQNNQWLLKSWSY